MAPTNGRNPVAAPQAAAPRFGLLASIPPTTDVPGWEQGITYVPEGCSNGSAFSICQTNGHARDDTDQNEPVEWEPFIIEVNRRCSAISKGVTDPEMEGQVLRELNQVTEYQLGLELWEGNIAASSTDSAGDPFPNVWLAHDRVDNLTPTGAVGLVHGLACLEQYLAENNGGEQGVIHATAQVVTHWESFRLLRREGNRILTFKDTIVVPSPGYTGTDPNGMIADNNVWAYATDIPRIFLGRPLPPTSLWETFDYKQNDVVYQAQRRAMVEWQLCRHAGVQLAITLCGIGGS